MDIFQTAIGRDENGLLIAVWYLDDDEFWLTWLIIVSM